VLLVVNMKRGVFWPYGFFYLLLFFPHLISAVADWMCHTSTHGVALLRI